MVKIFINYFSIDYLKNLFHLIIEIIIITTTAIETIKNATKTRSNSYLLINYFINFIIIVVVVVAIIIIIINIIVIKMTKIILKTIISYLKEFLS